MLVHRVFDVLMPTYQFRCPDGTIIERIFKISEVPEAVPAPDGSGEAVRIISGGAGLIFKGSGFYITDYGKDGKKDQRDATTRAEGKSESKGEPKAAGESKGTNASPPKAESSGSGSSAGGTPAGGSGGSGGSGASGAT